MNRNQFTEDFILAGFRTFLKASHGPTLLASFIYFTYSCGVWVANGTMAPFIKESLQLSPTQIGVLLSVPIFAGALMRSPPGILSQYIGRKNATLVACPSSMPAPTSGALRCSRFSRFACCS